MRRGRRPYGLGYAGVRRPGFPRGQEFYLQFQPAQAASVRDQNANDDDRETEKQDDEQDTQRFHAIPSPSCGGRRGGPMYGKIYQIVLSAHNHMFRIRVTMGSVDRLPGHARCA
jgi:hypothetical protein